MRRHWLWRDYRNCFSLRQPMFLSVLLCSNIVLLLHAMCIHDAWHNRLVNELLFEACVRNSERDVIDLTRAFKVCAAEVRDKNGRLDLREEHASTTLIVTVVKDCQITL
eukprot:2173480-Amphidinium_carterae.1